MKSSRTWLDAPQKSAINCSLNQLLLERMGVPACGNCARFDGIAGDGHVLATIEHLVDEHTQRSSATGPRGINRHPALRRLHTDVGMNVGYRFLSDQGAQVGREMAGVISSEPMGAHDDSRVHPHFTEYPVQCVALSRTSPPPFLNYGFRPPGTGALVGHIPDQRQGRLGRDCLASGDQAPISAILFQQCGEGFPMEASSPLRVDRPADGVGFGVEEVAVG